METEIEAKFPDINPNFLRIKLKKSIAVQIHPEVLMRRKTFDYNDRRLYKTKGWVRVRDEGDKVTLSYKQLNDRTLYGTKEVMVIVNDFERTCEFLIAVGFEVKSYQETKREKWKLNDVEITIDTWPWVPTFVELEGSSEKIIMETSKLLGLDWKNRIHGSVEPIYQMHYDVTEKEIDSWKLISFTPIPNWLLAKKKQ